MDSRGDGKRCPTRQAAPSRDPCDGAPSFRNEGKLQKRGNVRTRNSARGDGMVGPGCRRAQEGPSAPIIPRNCRKGHPHCQSSRRARTAALRRCRGAPGGRRKRPCRARRVQRMDGPERLSDGEGRTGRKSPQKSAPRSRRLRASRRAHPGWAPVRVVCPVGPGRRLPMYGGRGRRVVSIDRIGSSSHRLSRWPYAVTFRFTVTRCHPVGRSRIPIGKENVRHEPNPQSAARVYSC